MNTKRQARTAREGKTREVEIVAGALPTHQDRSRHTRDAILGAVDTALKGNILERATVQELARAAGVSIGAFYGRFEGKNAAIAALFNEQRTVFALKLRDLNDSAPDLHQWARKAVKLSMNHALSNRALIAWAAREGGVIPAVQQAAKKDSILIAESLSANLARLAPQLAVKDRASVAAFTIAMIGAMPRDAAVFSSSLLGDDKTRGWFARNLARAIEQYILSARQ